MAIFSSSKILDKRNNSKGKICWVKLAEYEGDESLDGIFRSKVRFFNQSLLQTTEVSINKVGDKSVKWLLKFFSGTKSEVLIRVFVNQRDPNPDNSFEERAFEGKIFSDQEASCRLFQGGSDVNKDVSEYLRGSQTFDLIEEANPHSPAVRVAAAGPKSCLVVQDTGMHEENFRQRFERLVLLQALALAYRCVIDSHAFRQTDAILDIAAGAPTFNELKSLREEVVSFDAAFVFDKPLRNDGQHEVSAFWEACSSAFGLRWRLGELNHQNSSVYNLLARKDAEEKRHRDLEQATALKQFEANRTAREKKSEKRQNRWNTIFGVLLALIGIGVTLVEPAYTWNDIYGWLLGTGETMANKFSLGRTYQ